MKVTILDDYVDVVRTLERYFADQFARVLAYAAGEPYGVVNPGARR